MAALLAGQGAAEVAAVYRIPEGTVRAWHAEMREESGVATRKREEIGALVLSYLASNLVALKAQTVVFADPTWLTAQDAQELAVLHGVMTDKAIRLLEALSESRSEPA